MDCTVGVLDRAAAHPTGVIRQDSAQHARVDGSGIRPDTAAMRLQHVVDESTDDARLEANEPPVRFYAVSAPMFGDIDQDSICHGLTRETRSRGAERHGNFILLCELEQGLYFTDRIGLNDSLRNESKIRRVIGVSDTIDQARVHAGRMDNLRELRLELHWLVFSLIVHLFITPNVR